MGNNKPTWILLEFTSPQPYLPLLALQRRLVKARHEGKLDTEILLCLEHTPVFTLGHNGGKENLRIPEKLLLERGIQLVKTERGGNITYHGPGQLILYPIINLRKARLRVTEYVKRLEDIMIRTAAEVGVTAARHPLHRGVWVGPRKLGSLGIAVRHGIAFHGLALNVNVSLEPFSWIDPCGLKGTTMTSLKEESGRDTDMETVRKILLRQTEGIFNVNIDRESTPTTKITSFTEHPHQGT